MKLPNPFWGRRPRRHLASPALDELHRSMASMLESFPKNENRCDVVLRYRIQNVV